MTQSSPSLTAPDFNTVVCTADIERPAEKVWSVIGSYADAGRFLDVPSKIVAGSGKIGSIRLIGDTILEVMVGSSRHSYAYAQIRGPMAPFAYHGCVALESNGPSRCTLIYTLTYDQASMDADRRASEFGRIAARFGGAATAMKLAAETHA